MLFGRWRQRYTTKPTNAEDEKPIKHTRCGVWDLYEEVEPSLPPGSSGLDHYWTIIQGLPYALKMLKDVGRLRDCWVLLLIYLVTTVISALIPATALWFSGQLLHIVETAIETRAVDRYVLIRVAGGRFFCVLVSRLVMHVKISVAVPLQQRIKSHYAAHILEAYARLDLPSFDDPMVQAQLESASRSDTSVAWTAMRNMTSLFSMVLQLVSQSTVLIGVLRDQRDGELMALLSLISPVLEWLNWPYDVSRGVWAATCRNQDYLRMKGLKLVVAFPEHRKEVIAGDMSKHLVSEFREAQNRVGNDAGDFWEVRDRLYQNRLSLSSFLSEPFREIPMVIFALRAIQYPASIPISLASLNLIQSTVSSFYEEVLNFVNTAGSIAEQIGAVRKLYDINTIPERVPDGNLPFPENQQKIHNGVSVEFRNVSFRYPGSDTYALQNVSFNIGRGQLCLILGNNGSGKSTILNLITRLYDPSEGEILFDDKDIRTIRLADLRRATSVLFQNYTHFPLSIKENIGLGDPARARDEDRVEEAARLGGAYDFVNQLPEKFDTYLERPVQDAYSPLLEGTRTIFGRTVDYSRLREHAGLSSSSATHLSGGQMQRLAVSRTFMRSLGPDNGVGLLLFDEPSASLDPVAEHDLFERLRELRGNKTMVFSSHRFGNLTRHADLIICMKDSRVQEMGTHEDLLNQGAGYARIYTLQAQAFLP